MAGVTRRLLILMLAFSVAPVSAESMSRDGSANCPYEHARAGAATASAASATVSDLSLTAGGLGP